MSNLTRILAGLFFLIGAVYFLVLWNKWYLSYPWFDIPMHIAGGAWAVILLFRVFEKRGDGYLFTSPRWISVILALGFAAFVGILWEFAEFLYDVFISPTRGLDYVMQRGVADTLKDLFFDIIGGFVAWAAIIRLKKH